MAALPTDGTILPMRNPPLSSLRFLLCIAAFGLAASGCGRGPDDSNEAPPMSAEVVKFHAEQQAWRDQRKADLLAPEGWASLIGLHWIEPGAHYLGSGAGNGMQLALGPAQMGMLELKRDGMVRFVPEPGVGLMLDGAPLTAATVLRADDDPAGASRLEFDQGEGVAVVIKRGARHALRVRHAAATTRTGFSGIEYWAADPKWRVEGRFVAHPPGRTMEIANIIGIADEVANPGTIEFEHGGASHRLEAIDEGGDELFLVFADRTNGQGSYGAGRFLYADKPDASGRVTLDFNRAYNPPCAFTAFATCPLPPPENRLALTITAGEKAYAHATR